ncbi:MAG: ferredoxin [Clostridium sp.]
MDAKVDKDSCIGCALCPSICPEVFEMDDDGKAMAKATVPQGKEDEARDAESSCPVNAISIE